MALRTPRMVLALIVALLATACSIDSSSMEYTATGATDALTPILQSSIESAVEPAAAAQSQSSAGASSVDSAPGLAPFELSAWIGPLDPELILNRLGVSDQWQGSPTQTTGAEFSDRACQMIRVDLPSSTTFWSRTWFPDESFTALSAHAYQLSSEADATNFVSTAQSHIQTCADSMSTSNEIGAVDVLAEFGLSASPWTGVSRTVEIANGRSATTWHFFSRYGSDVYHAVVQPSEVEPDQQAIEGARALLRSFQPALSFDRLLPDSEYSAAENDNLETFLNKDYGSAWLAWTPTELSCFADQFRTFDQPNGAAEYIVERWCVPDFQAKQWAASDNGRFGTRIEDDDQRLCFRTVTVMTLRGNSFQEALRIEASGSPFSEDPADLDILNAPADSPIRAAFDQRLLAECGMSADDGVIAGLSPHQPLDKTPEREPFCSGWSEGYDYDRDLPEVDLLVARYTANAERNSRLVAPTQIADDWATLGIYYTEKARVHDEGRLSETDIYDHEEFQAFEDHIGFTDANDAVFEYLRINCGYEPR